MGSLSVHGGRSSPRPPAARPASARSVPRDEHSGVASDPPARPEDALIEDDGDYVNIIDAYNELGSYRAAARLCGTTDKTVRRTIERQRAGGPWFGP